LVDLNTALFAEFDFPVLWKSIYSNLSDSFLILCLESNPLCFLFIAPTSPLLQLYTARR